ncbi:MAG TPA: TetR/AcrR family transcriptional regulator [Myxococcota bacterium]|jgi:AcrR family transcriptional regulator
MRSAQPAERRRRPSRADARRAILDATEALLLEDGLEAFSMRRLVDRCGYTAPTIYHYFGDKQSLIDELVEQRCRVLLRSLRRVPVSDDPVADLRAMCLAFVRFGLRHRTFYRLLSMPLDAGRTPPPSAEAARARLQAPLEKLAAAGRVPAGIEPTGQALWAYLHGHILLRTARPDHPWEPGVLELGLDALVRGLILPDRARPDPAFAPAVQESSR